MNIDDKVLVEVWNYDFNSAKPEIQIGKYMQCIS